MPATRPNTGEYSKAARDRLGVAIERAREGAGHPFRPSFAEAIGKSVRSLFKLEKGQPVGPSVYEAAARALPNWTLDTPQAILEGAEPPDAEVAVPPSAFDQDDDALRAIARFYWDLRRHGVSHKDFVLGVQIAGVIFDRDASDSDLAPAVLDEVVDLYQGHLEANNPE